MSEEFLRQEEKELKPELKTHVIFVSGNPGKIEEAQSIFGDMSTKIKFKRVNLVEIQGEPEYIAVHKCEAAASIFKGAVIIEDTSLCFNALEGLPGPYIKSFFDKLGSYGLFKLLAGHEDKSATAICTIAFSEGPGKDVKLFQGEIKGTIVCPTGKAGFGWDPCFMPEGESETFGEISQEKKNAISHRRKALNMLKDFLAAREENLMQTSKKV